MNILKQLWSWWIIRNLIIYYDIFLFCNNKETWKEKNLNCFYLVRTIVWISLKEKNKDKGKKTKEKKFFY